MKTTMKTFVALVGVMLVVALSPSWAQAVPTASITMADLLQGTTITVGDKLFFDFHDYLSNASGGATAVNPATIFVSPLVEGDELGLLFQSATFYTGSGQTQDTHFDFRVVVLDANMLISDNTLKMTAGVNGTGRVSVAENAKTADEQTLLAQKLVSIIAPGGNIYDHEEFLFPVSTIHVSKDIGLVGGAEGQAFVSDFTQTFSQVPEPATLALLGLGGLVTLIRRKRSA